MSSFVPPCRCGGWWVTVAHGTVVIVICSSCQALAHPSVAAQFTRDH